MRVGTVGMPAIQAETVEFLNEDQTGAVKNGVTEVTNIKAPSGYIYEILAIRMGAAAPIGSANGTHGFALGSESAGVGIGLGLSVFNSEIAYDHKEWRIADSVQRPDGDAGEALCFVGMRFDAIDGLDVNYQNNTNVNQTGDRTIRLCVRKLKVAT